MEKQNMAASTNLRARFAAANKKPRHFVVWAAGMGHKIQYATVSRHMAGTQGITVPWAIAYDYFFQQAEATTDIIKITSQAAHGAVASELAEHIAETDEFKCCVVSFSSPDQGFVYQVHRFLPRSLKTKNK